MGKIDELTNEASAMQKPVSDIAERGGSGAIAQLIQQYCPDGVEYVNVGDVCDIHKGVQFNKSDMKEMGSYPVMNGGINPSGYAEVFNEDENTITISQGGASAGYVNFLDSKFWLGAHCYALKPYSVVMNRYLYHYIKQNEITLQQCQYGAGIPALAKSTISSLEIPLPPLPVQEAIVNILDRFAVYAAELQAELQARQQQYNYYRDTLLSFEGREDVKEFSVGEIATFTYGYTTKANDEGNIRYIRITDINEQGCLNPSDGKFIYQSPEVEPYLLRKGDLVMARTGATYGKTLYYNEEYPSAYASFLIKISFNDLVNPRYYWHFSKSIKYWEQARRLVGGGAQPQFNTGAISQVKITLPPLAEQQRIVDILDRFDTLINDLSQGLPAEIEARQQQYEYYRDKLLTFKKKEA